MTISEQVQLELQSDSTFSDWRTRPIQTDWQLTIRIAIFMIALRKIVDKYEG